MVELRTERLLLRPAIAADLMPIHAILANPRATAFWSTPPHHEVEQSRLWLQRMIETPKNEGEEFVIEHQGRVIGKAGLYRFPEIGFIFDPAFWGRGFAAEAIRPLLERAFTVHRLETVEADVDPRNAMCLKLLAHLDFRETGRRRRTWLVGDRWCDSVYFSLSGTEWSRARSIACHARQVSLRK